LLTIGLTVYAYGQISPPAPALFAYGREAAKRRGDAPMLVVREGVHSPIVVTHWPNHHDVTALHLDGKLVASDDKIDLRVERMLGHIPQLIVDRPRSVLVVGLGAGITAGAFAIDPRTEQITICELEPALPPITAKFFGEANHHVLNDPRTTLILNDARHYLRTSGRQFDVIAVDPIHPWVHGAAALYSLEFFSHCRDHVSAGGVVSFWVPLHSMSTAAVQCELATFFQVFPHATVWHTGGTTLQRHLMMIGSREAQVIDFARVDRLTSPGEPFDRSLQEMGFAAPDEMLALFLGDDQSLSGWLSGVPLNRDRNLRLEYLAGAAAYRNERQKVFAKVARFRTWPKKLFRGDFARQEAIRLRLPAADHIEGDEEAKTWRHRRPRTPPGLRDRIASHLSPLPLS
jgi:spermidine synthase